VWVWGTDRTATTDEAGRFLIDGIPPGTHLVVVEHESVDSVGLPAIGASVWFQGGDTVEVALATPSPETLWRRTCSRAAIVGTGRGIVFGVVRDADAGALRAGATVTARWLGFEQRGGAQVVVREMSATARTDSTGLYLLCGVLDGVVVHIQAVSEEEATGIIPVSLVVRPVGRADLMLAGARGASVTASTGGRVVRGVIRSEQGRAVARAQVAVEGGDSTFTDAEGRFVLAGLPLGTQLIRVRAIGYAPFQHSVDVRPRDTVVVGLQLRTLTVLDTVHVVASRRLSQRLEELAHRRLLGGGHVLTEAEIKLRPSVRSLFQGMPSMRVTGSAHRFAIFMRSGSIGRGWCAPTVYLDGVRSSVEELRAYRPKDIVGVEVYPRQSAAPGEYQEPYGGCGVVLVWTKHLR
jgi:hypothetical protein